MSSLSPPESSPYTPYCRLHRSSAPSSELLSLAQAKLYLRVDHADEDVLISEMIIAVRQVAEDFLGRSLVPQDWRVTYDTTSSCITLPMGPVQHIIEVQRGGVTITPTYYTLEHDMLSLDHAGQAGQLLSVAYHAGETLAQPHALSQAMLAHIGLCYERRDADQWTLMPAQHLYAPYREVRV